MLLDIPPPTDVPRDAIAWLISFLGGYLLGSIPFGLLVARMAGLGDIRKIGSGNIGATNVLRTGNRWAALLTLLGDGGKGAAAVIGLGSLFGGTAGLVAGLAAFLGHLFPVWLKFKGGKGVATFLGILLAIDWMAGLAACATWLMVATLSRYSSLSALAAALAAPFFLWLLHRPDLAYFAGALALVVFFTHRANITRLIAGTEPRIGAPPS